PNEFITYSYWTVTDSGLLSQNVNSIITNPPVVLVNNTQDVYMLSIPNNAVAIYNLTTGLYTTIKLPYFSTYDNYYYNNNDGMVATTNGTFVFVIYSSNKGSTIATINTKLQKIVKINYDLPPGIQGDFVISPDNKYIYDGTGYSASDGYIFSVYDLTHYNSTQEIGIDGNFSISFANIGTIVLPINPSIGTGPYGLGYLQYQRLAISPKTEPAP
ncbi:MAG: hypothetical protein QXD23_02300, partial [Candidatus Micrarchaeaceae archaeon]